MVSQNKTGFSLGGKWYLFPEEAIYLIQLQLCEVGDSTDKEKRLPLSRVYEIVYDHPEDLCNTFNVNYFYHCLRKKGCFARRYESVE